MSRRRDSEVPGVTGSEIVDQQDDEEPKPETFVDWVVWLLLWPAVTIAWLVAVPFVLIYVTLELALGFRSRRRDG